MKVHELITALQVLVTNEPAAAELIVFANFKQADGTLLRTHAVCHDDERDRFFDAPILNIGARS